LPALSPTKRFKFGTTVAVPIQATFRVVLRITRVPVWSWRLFVDQVEKLFAQRQIENYLVDSLPVYEIVDTGYFETVSKTTQEREGILAEKATFILL
jgi:hypothetical protein